ncbi:unnamed protein product [Adineta ricciae]|uniref:Uncharacterized protein n=1 Tax=Adineta ricciae TaxID=249248 RepID=A0A814V3H7_ADIRI|nr:unnamed protein product [Adineta ricciae]CAF1258128.1 unnamed protein product [Adineta ricciae]
MPGSSKKITRLEKEAFLRVKDSEYKREQSAYLLTNDYDDDEAFENERHRRFTKIRQTHQIEREIDHQVGLIDKMKDRREAEAHKKQVATTRSFIATLPPPSKPSPSASSSSSLAPAAKTERIRRSVQIKEKYSTEK